MNKIKAITEEVPEGLEGFYTQREDGKYQLQVEPVDGYSLEDVGGLKSALGKEREARSKFEKIAESLGDLTPEQARDAIAELERLREIDPSKEADRLAQEKVEHLRKSLQTQFTSELSERDKRIASLTQTVDERVRKQEALSTLSELGGNHDLLMPHILGATRTVEKDGKYLVEVVDADGNPRIGNDGNNLTLKAFVAEMRNNESFAPAFKGSGNSGSGKFPSGGNTTQNKGDLGGSRADRMNALRNRFPELR